LKAWIGKFFTSEGLEMKAIFFILIYLCESF